MKKIFLFLLMGVLVIELSGCGTKTEKKDTNTKENTTSNIEEKKEEEKIKINPELADVEAFVIDDYDVVGIKKDGSKVMILEGIAKNKKMHSIEYTDGKIYLSQAETKLDYPTKTSRSKMLVVKKVWYDEIDLTKGDGNYKAEKIYEYENEDSENTYMPAPHVYNGKLYIVKNSDKLISIDLNTKEETVIDEEVNKKANNTIYGTYIYLDKNNGNIYYTGPIGNSVVLAQYNLSTNKRTIIENNNNVVYHFWQFTKDGFVFDTQDYDKGYNVEVKKYTFADNKINKINTSNVNAFYSCGNNYFTTIDAGSVYGSDFGPHYMNIVAQDENFKTADHRMKPRCVLSATNTYLLSNRKSILTIQM